MSAFLNQITLQIIKTNTFNYFKGIKISVEESEKLDVKQKILDFKKHMNYIFIEFVRLVDMKEFGKAVKMATNFTDEIEDFHEQILSYNSPEEIYLV